MLIQSNKGLLKPTVWFFLTVAYFIVFNLHCQAQGLVGAPVSTGRGDYYVYYGAQLYEIWKFAPLPAFLITSVLAALLWNFYYKPRKSAKVAKLLLAAVPVLMTGLVLYVVNHLQQWSVEYQISQYEPPPMIPGRF